MIADISDLSRFGSFISKQYAPDFFRLLVAYHDISASEAASQLGIHIQTSQEFLEAMTELHVLVRQECIEKKRPYFRYSLKKEVFHFQFKPEDLVNKSHANSLINNRIKEVKNAGAQFSLSRSGAYFSSVSIRQGKGRMSKMRKLSLTEAQGKFLYHLPYPDADALQIAEIMEIAKIDESYKAEIEHIVLELIKYQVIEKL
ncbi:MAG: hypothetical protein JW729_07035 [Bacteroidales bacterium]|nr:hypothetical protein [Bacteroidales bacterium]